MSCQDTTCSARPFAGLFEYSSYTATASGSSFVPIDPAEGVAGCEDVGVCGRLTLESPLSLPAGGTVCLGTVHVRAQAKPPLLGEIGLPTSGYFYVVATSGAADLQITEDRCTPIRSMATGSTVGQFISRPATQRR